MDIWYPANQGESYTKAIAKAYWRSLPDFSVQNNTSNKMIIQGFDYMSEIELEVVQGSLVLTQDNDTMTLEDDEVTKLARFIEDDNERELYLIGSNIVARKSDTTAFVSLKYSYLESGTTYRSNMNILLSESMCDELLENLVNMGVA
jgi:hypothetical protein